MSDDPRGPLDFEPDDTEGTDPSVTREDDAAEQRRRWAHRRDPDFEPTPGRKPGDPVPVPRPPGSSRYVWFVGVVFLLVIIVAMVNAISNGGVRAPTSGGDLAPFAAPLVLSSLEGDANLATGREGESKEVGRRPACDVRGADILNSCELRERGPVVLVFFADRGSQCVRQLDVLERVQRRHPRVQAAAVAIRGDRDKLRGLIREHRWSFPVGWDRDGGVSNVYGVSVCPQITFARRGGRIVDTTFGELSEPELEAAMKRLER